MKVSDRIKYCHVIANGWCVELEDENGNGTRIGPYTQDKKKAMFAASVVRALVRDLETNHPKRISEQIGPLGCLECKGKDEG